MWATEGQAYLDGNELKLEKRNEVRCSEEWINGPTDEVKVGLNEHAGRVRFHNKYEHHLQSGYRMSSRLRVY